MGSGEILLDVKKTRPYKSDELISSGGSRSNAEQTLSKSMDSGELLPGVNKTHHYKMISHGLPEIVRDFKSFSARRINRARSMRGVAICQRYYYDHIIRSDQDLCNIWEYIRTNPQKWQEDQLRLSAEEDQ